MHNAPGAAKTDARATADEETFMVERVAMQQRMRERALIDVLLTVRNPNYDHTRS